MHRCVVAQKVATTFIPCADINFYRYSVKNEGANVAVRPVSVMMFKKDKNGAKVMTLRVVCKQKMDHCSSRR